MSNFSRLVIPIRSYFYTTSPANPFRAHCNSSAVGKHNPFKTWLSGLEPVFRIQAARSEIATKRGFLRYLNFSGRKLNFGCLCGSSAVIGLATVWPSIAYASGGNEALEKNDHVDSWDASGCIEEDQFMLWEWARKFWSPAMLVMTVMMGWMDPFSLAINVALLFFSTKPSPYSIYHFIGQWQRQSLRQEPGLYKLKVFAPKRVEVKDYNFLCLASVELIDRKMILIGILGGWWILHSSPCSAAESWFGFKALKNLWETKAIIQ